MTAKEHNKLLAIFFLINGGLQALGGIVVTLIYGGIGAAFMTNARRSEDQMLGGFFLIFAIVAALIVFVFAGIAFFAGWKLLKQKSGARTWGIIASCVALLGFPLGTALGIYGLWFLFGEGGKQFYSGANSLGNYPPPPLNQWQ
jgi:heme A synthase